MGDEETASSIDCPHSCESLTVKGKNEFRFLHRGECKVFFFFKGWGLTVHIYRGGRRKDKLRASLWK